MIWLFPYHIPNQPSS